MRENPRLNSFISKHKRMIHLDKFLSDDRGDGNATRGLIAGLIGGLAGTAVKAAVERFLEVREVDYESAQMRILDDLSNKLTGNTIDVENEGLAKQIVNIPLGVSVGAAYGYGKRDQTETNLLDGAFLGATTWASTHESTLPLVGIEKSEEDIPLKTQLSELFSHVLYGVTTEVVRSYVNEKLIERDMNKENSEEQPYQDENDDEEYHSHH